MPRVEIYLTRWCPYCHTARGLLDRKGVAYEVIDVGEQPDRRAEMTQRALGRRTVPQIFIDGKPMGGSDLWGSPPWKIKSSRQRSSRCSTPSMKWTSWAFRMGAALGATRMMRWMRSRWGLNGVR